MRRCDLPIGYDGWQVVGVSPSGHAPIGPLPVKAVRERQDRKMFGNDIAMLTAMLHSEVHHMYMYVFVIVMKYLRVNNKKTKHAMTLIFTMC